MLERFAGKMVAWQIEKGYLSDEARAAYEYAYEALLNQILNLLIAVLIAVFLQAPLIVLIFLVSYIPLRSFCGGYHANTNLGCTAMSTILTVCICVSVKRMLLYPLQLPAMIGFLISGAVIVRWAPVADCNKPLDAAETAQYRHRSRGLWLLEAVIGIICCLWYPPAGYTMALGHLVMSIMIGLGILKNRILEKDRSV